jgi:hypothetical protein
VTGAPEIEYERFLLSEYLLLRQMVRAAALSLQSRDAIRLVPAPPLPQRRPGYATAAADHAGVAKLLVEPDPAEASSCIHRFRGTRWMTMDLMDGIRRPQLHSHNRIINLRAIDSLEVLHD